MPQKTIKKEDYLMERIPFRLHRPESERKDFRTVTVNGKTFQIAYGKEVQLPRYVVQVLEESEANDQAARLHAEERAEAFARGESSLEG
jgi:hypothetical protein|nr:MAG TPA: hypothetical protein [Caudoviricetes sp.]